MSSKKYFIFAALAALALNSHAQDTARYTGTTLSNVDYHHGQLTPAVGVHNIQTFRANRQHPELAGDTGWTYNHAPDMAYWNGTFYMHYLSNARGEHIGAGQTLLQTSKDGYHWTKPAVIFPPYRVADGTPKEGQTIVAKDNYSVMHQRMGFYTSKDGRLLALGFYGLVLHPKDDPNDGNGIGRVVREINKDGSWGPIYFIRYNHAFNEKNTNYPFYKKSKDKGFVKACDELLAQPLQMQQWVEEADREDPLIPLKQQFKAFSYYTLKDGRNVGFWKSALTSISKDGGKTWEYNPLRAPGFVNSNAKIWGQQTTDGKYATVYNPSEFRWPLAVSVSKEGLNYDNLLLVHGEISGMRYGGEYKSYGPQYVRGLQAMNGQPADGSMWLTYSVNKEDLWVSKVPVPVVSTVDKDVNDDFTKLPAATALNQWNIYSPLWASVEIAKMKNGTQALKLHDEDLFDFAKAEHVLPEAESMKASFTIIPEQVDAGSLEIELVNEKGQAGMRLKLDSTGSVYAKAGYRDKKIGAYKAGEPLNIEIDIDVKKRMFTVALNGGKPGNNLMFQPLASINRITFRTGEVRMFPNALTPTDPDYDLEGAGDKAKPATFWLLNLKTERK